MRGLKLPVGRLPPDSAATAAAYRVLMAGALRRLSGHRGSASRALAAALRDGALGRLPSAERAWIARIERRRRELVSAGPMGAGVRWTGIPPVWGRFLIRLMRELAPRSCLELGTGLGFSAAYQGAALELNGAGRLVTLDAEPGAAGVAAQSLSALALDDRVELQLGPIGDTLPAVLERIAPVDYVFADADHTEEATLEHFATLLPHLSDGAVVVFDDINWTEGMRRAWQQIARHDRVSVALGMGRIGVAVIRHTARPAEVPGPWRIRPWALRGSSWLPLTSTFRALPVAIHGLAGELRVAPGARVLDYGCGDAGYRRLFPSAEYVGADLPGNPHATLEIPEDGTVPADDESFDAVLSTQVLEHVPDPALYLSECVRVLRPGGRLLLSTHGIMVFHPVPEDYWRWTRPGLERVLERAGLRLVRLEGVMGVTSTALMLIHTAVDPRLPGPLRLGLALCVQALTAIAERVQSTETRNRDAMIFALVAEKPSSSS